MKTPDELSGIRKYFQNRLDEYGTTPRGADWNSIDAQYARFTQLARIIDPHSSFSILDYGCGYGAFADFLVEKGYPFSRFYGFDILESMVEKASELHVDRDRYQFFSNLDQIPAADYAVASGVFNIRVDATYQEWTNYVFSCLDQMNELSTRGFAVNFLTKYSDPERMVIHLYYADPCIIFDHCKKHYSKNVALLHDYSLYDFTILVKK